MQQQEGKKDGHFVSEFSRISSLIYRSIVPPVQSCTWSPLLYIRFPFALLNRRKENRETRAFLPQCSFCSLSRVKHWLDYSSWLRIYTKRKNSRKKTLCEQCSESPLHTIEQLYNKASVTIHQRANNSCEDLNRQSVRGFQNNNNGSICKEQNTWLHTASYLVTSCNEPSLKNMSHLVTPPYSKKRPNGRSCSLSHKIHRLTNQQINISPKFCMLSWWAGRLKSQKWFQAPHSSPRVTTTAKQKWIIKKNLTMMLRYCFICKSFCQRRSYSHKFL